jgi:hypothetical protein
MCNNPQIKLVQILSTQQRAEGKITPKAIFGLRATQPKVRRANPKYVHVTNPLHAEETHSGGIPHIDSMTDYIKE